MKYSALLTLALSLSASARPARRAAFTAQNGQDAINLNNQFQSLTPDSSCTEGQDACVNNQFAQCVNGKFVTTACATGEVCAALPLVNSAGTSITCTTQSDLDSRIAATGAQAGSSFAASSAPAATGTAATNTGTSAAAAATTTTGTSAAAAATNSAGNGNNNGGNGNDNGNIQTSLTLDPSVIANGFAQNGQGANGSEAGQVPSLTSTNNFINFCASVNQPITNGQQITGGSCNPAPMGQIPSSANMPSAKFTNPKNLDTIPANQDFTITMAINNMETGNFVNADANYFSAPQQLNGQGQIVGHSHVVVEQLSAIDQTTPTNPQKFAFFKGLNAAAQNGVLSADVAGGLPAGTYKLSSINTGANHAPVLVPIAQHGSLDDAVYFTVTDNGGGNAAQASSTAAATAQASATQASATQASATQAA